MNLRAEVQKLQLQIAEIIAADRADRAEQTSRIDALAERLDKVDGGAPRPRPRNEWDRWGLIYYNGYRQPSELEKLRAENSQLGTELVALKRVLDQQVWPRTYVLVEGDGGFDVVTRFAADRIAAFADKEAALDWLDGQYAAGGGDVQRYVDETPVPVEEDPDDCDD